MELGGFATRLQVIFESKLNQSDQEQHYFFKKNASLLP
jgi:hypothetical protein